VAEAYNYSSWLRPRNEDTPAAAAKSARVQPFKCSQQVMLSRTRRKRGNSRCSLSSLVNGGNEKTSAAAFEAARVQPLNARSR
jgi:hypothetical protein